MMSGQPEFDRIFRVQLNTLEWMPIFLPLLWLFAYYVSDMGAAVLGLVWIAARILYMVTYTKDAAKRGPGFAIQAARLRGSARRRARRYRHEPRPWRLTADGSGRRPGKPRSRVVLHLHSLPFIFITGRQTDAAYA